MQLMWRVVKTLWVTGKTLIIDSGLFVLGFLIDMIYKGVYGSTLVKKRRYFPTGIYEDGINYHCERRKNVIMTLSK